VGESHGRFRQDPLRACRYPLEFDGRHDAPFDRFDASGRQHMEYVRDRGASADVPVVDIIEAFERHYPGLIAVGAAGPVDRFRKEAERVPEAP
jgi:hypothetical protein